MTARVLVVDDILSNVKLLEAKLTTEYFEVVTAFSGLEALAKIGNVVMPDLWNLNSFLFILLFTLITLLLFYLIDRMGMQRKSKD